MLLRVRGPRDNAVELHRPGYQALMGRLSETEWLAVTRCQQRLQVALHHYTGLKEQMSKQTCNRATKNESQKEAFKNVLEKMEAIQAEQVDILSRVREQIAAEEALALPEILTPPPPPPPPAPPLTPQLRVVLEPLQQRQVLARAPPAAAECKRGVGRPPKPVRGRTFWQKTEWEPEPEPEPELAAVPDPGPEPPEPDDFRLNIPRDSDPEKHSKNCRMASLGLVATEFAHHLRSQLRTKPRRQAFDKTLEGFLYSNWRKRKVFAQPSGPAAKRGRPEVRRGGRQRLRCGRPDSGQTSAAASPPTAPTSPPTAPTSRSSSPAAESGSASAEDSLPLPPPPGASVYQGVHRRRCERCAGVGQLLACDTCPRVYHPACLLSAPPTDTDARWSCAACVDAAAPGWSPPPGKDCRDGAHAATSCRQVADSGVRLVEQASGDDSEDVAAVLAADGPLNTTVDNALLGGTCQRHTNAAQEASGGPLTTTVDKALLGGLGGPGGQRHTNAAQEASGGPLTTTVDKALLGGPGGQRHTNAAQEASDGQGVVPAERRDTALGAEAPLDESTAADAPDETVLLTRPASDCGATTAPGPGPARQASVPVPVSGRRDTVMAALSGEAAPVTAGADAADDAVFSPPGADWLARNRLFPDALD